MINVPDSNVTYEVRITCPVCLSVTLVRADRDVVRGEIYKISKNCHGCGGILVVKGMYGYSH